MNDIHKDCKWQTRDEMDDATNPLQALAESLSRTSKDMSSTKFDAWLYGIILGWDDEAYEELAQLYNWSKKNIEYNKSLHQNYIDAWNLWMQKQNQ